MKVVLFATLALAIGSLGQSGALAASTRGEGARFAAMSLNNGQGARAIVSNVLAPANGSQIAPCQMQVRFFGADGSLIGKATTAQLKAGESISVPAQDPSKLVRAVVSIGDVVDPAKVCALRTSVEIFDVETGTTLVLPSCPITFSGDNRLSPGLAEFPSPARNASLSLSRASAPDVAR